MLLVGAFVYVLPSQAKFQLLEANRVEGFHLVWPQWMAFEGQVETGKGDELSWVVMLVDFSLCKTYRRPFTHSVRWRWGRVKGESIVGCWNVLGEDCRGEGEQKSRRHHSIATSSSV